MIGILTGPTATGKTALALELAEKHGHIEIINADSMLVYRHMDIGTAKPSAAELRRIPHHLIDIREPDQPYTAGDFVTDVQTKIQEIRERGNRPLIVGGTGFYLKALLLGLWEAAPGNATIRAELENRDNTGLYQELEAKDPVSAIRIGKNDRYRLIRSLELIKTTGKTPMELQAERPRTPNPEYALWILDRDDQELSARISARTHAMIKAGLVEETQKIREMSPNARALTAVGYRETCRFLDGIEPEGRKIAPGTEGLEQEIRLGTRQLVKRQRTWFRGQTNGSWFILDRDLTAIHDAFAVTYPKSIE